MPPESTATDSSDTTSAAESPYRLFQRHATKSTFANLIQRPELRGVALSTLQGVFYSVFQAPNTRWQDAFTMVRLMKQRCDVKQRLQNLQSQPSATAQQIESSRRSVDRLTVKIEQLWDQCVTNELIVSEDLHPYFRLNASDEEKMRVQAISKARVLGQQKAESSKRKRPDDNEDGARASASNTSSCSSSSSSKRPSSFSASKASAAAEPSAVASNVHMQQPSNIDSPPRPLNPHAAADAEVAGSTEAALRQISELEVRTEKVEQAQEQATKTFQSHAQRLTNVEHTVQRLVEASEDYDSSSPTPPPLSPDTEFRRSHRMPSVASNQREYDEVMASRQQQAHPNQERANESSGGDMKGSEDGMENENEQEQEQEQEQEDQDQEQVQHESTRASESESEGESESQSTSEMGQSEDHQDGDRSDEEMEMDPEQSDGSAAIGHPAGSIPTTHQSMPTAEPSRTPTPEPTPTPNTPTPTPTPTPESSGSTDGGGNPFPPNLPSTRASTSRSEARPPDPSVSHYSSVPELNIETPVLYTDPSTGDISIGANLVAQVRADVPGRARPSSFGPVEVHDEASDEG